MTRPGEHPSDDLQLLMEDLLAAEQRRRVEAHLLGCTRCRRELQALRQARELARAPRDEPAMPPGLAARISGSLDAEDRRARARPLRWWAPLGLAAAAIIVLLVSRAREPDFVAAAAADFRQYLDGSLPLDRRTGDPAEMGRYFAQRGQAELGRVFDFGMMGYRLEGGRLHRLAGRDATLFAYRAGPGRDILCLMYPGTLDELPPGSGERARGAIIFRIYQRPGMTLVFWQEGDVVCVLVSSGDPEEAVQLAMAKAETVEPRERRQ